VFYTNDSLDRRERVKWKHLVKGGCVGRRAQVSSVAYIRGTQTSSISLPPSPPPLSRCAVIHTYRISVKETRVRIFTNCTTTISEWPRRGDCERVSKWRHKCKRKRKTSRALKTLVQRARTLSVLFAKVKENETISWVPR